MCLGSSWSEEIGNTTKRNIEDDSSALISSANAQDHLERDCTIESISRKRSSSLQQPSDNDEKTEEFRDSTAFLKGTQSLNPHNDYSQNFVDCGQRPQNFIRKF